MDSLVSSMGAAPPTPKPKPAPQLPIVPDGIYFLSGAQYAQGQKIDAPVYMDAPVKGADGQTYQHVVAQ